MISKKTRLVLLSFCILCLCGWFYFYKIHNSLPIIYDSTIDNTSFQDVQFEKDSGSGNLPEKSISSIQTSDSDLSEDRHNHTRTHRTRGFENVTKITSATKVKYGTNTQISKITEVPVKPVAGKELKASDFRPDYKANARIRLTAFYHTFKNGDYISGKEFAQIYRKDPNLNKIEKSTICSFIEKDISHISRYDNVLIIHTVKENGIHTKFKIPFVQDLRIDIENGATVEIGETFSSTETGFFKTILMPVKLNDITILHNGEAFPQKGFISGDYYFIDYSKSKMAYKLH